MGGEFLNVNFRRQQGLVRFAVRDLAPNDQGPRFSAADFTPNLRPVGTGAVRVSWPANADFDNERLTYSVIRNGAVVWTGEKPSQIWDRPTQGWTDTGLSVGASYNYQVRVSDPFGNTVTSPTVAVTADGTGPVSAYAQTVMADGAAHYWRLGDGGTTGAIDTAGVDDAITGTALTRGAAGASPATPPPRSRSRGTSNSRVIGNTREQNRNTVSVEAWVRTTSNQGGWIVGFGNSASLTGTSGNRDRQLYMESGGRVQFGASPGQNRTVRSAASYNNGQWHHIVGTLGADGHEPVRRRRARRLPRGHHHGPQHVGLLADRWRQPERLAQPAVVEQPVRLHRRGRHLPERAHGRHGGRAQHARPHRRRSEPAAGSVVHQPRRTGSPWTSTAPPRPTRTARSRPTRGPTATAATATGVNPAAHAYSTAGTYTVTLTVTDDDGDTGVATRDVTVAPPAPNQPPVAAFTATPTGLSVAVDGSGSSDPDGTVTSYAWNFGDAGTATGPTPPAHAYAAAGTYTVTLIVTDDDGAPTTLAKDVTVTAPPANAPFAVDTFNRTVTGGWASAETGGAWTVAGGAANFSVAPNVGTMRVTGAGFRLSSFLPVSSTSTDLTARVSMNVMPTGSGTDLELVGRSAGTTDGYRLRLKMLSTGVVRASLVGISAGVTTTVSQVNVPGVTYAAGQTLAVRFQVDGSGTTTLRGKVWVAGTAEPGGVDADGHRRDGRAAGRRRCRALGLHVQHDDHAARGRGWSQLSAAPVV